MSKKRVMPRASGILMPIFSLQSPYGIGTFGKKAYEFVDFLEKAGQKYWQILPLGHTDGSSPYQCFSAVAGNPYFIDLDKLVEMGLLTKEFLETYDLCDNSKVNYEYLKVTRMDILHTAYRNINSNLDMEVSLFAEENLWVEDYALFMAIMDVENKPIWEWTDENLKRFNPSTIVAYREKFKEEIKFYYFVQYLFFKQWNDLKSYANGKGIKIIGDMPIYVSSNSVDIWVKPCLFKVDANCKPSGIAGVPPDYFSEEGQLWGNPTYNWENHEKDDFQWWIWRIHQATKIYDIVRIDHFRAFADYWEVPAGEKTAVNGKWLLGPGFNFFKKIRKRLGNVPIIAEDLGEINNNVRKLLKKTKYPGMGVMVFGLRANEDNSHLPHNWKRNSVGYTTTHDNGTFLQELESLSMEDKKFAKSYLNMQTGDKYLLEVIRTVYASRADTVIIPIADILSYGAEARINTPGTVGEHNWSWRLCENVLSDELAKHLQQLVHTYKRL